MDKIIYGIAEILTTTIPIKFWALGLLINYFIFLVAGLKKFWNDNHPKINGNPQANVRAFYAVFWAPIMLLALIMTMLFLTVLSKMGGFGG